MGEKGAVMEEKGAVSDEKGVIFFLSEGHQNGQKGRCYGRKGFVVTGLKGAISAQRGAISVPKSVVTAS